MPRMTAAAPAASQQKVNVSVDMPQNAPATPPVTEERPPTWFWDLLQEVPKDKWGSVYDVMGFRLDPKPGVQAGAKGFLFQVFEPITPMWIKQNYGGGKFRCILEMHSKFHKSHEFDVEGQPRYDLTREIPNVPIGSNGSNGSDPALLRILEQQISKLNEQLAAAQLRGENNPALSETVNILSTGYKQAIAAVKDQIPASGDQTAQLTALLTAAEKIATIRQPNGGSSSTLDRLLEAALPKLLEKLVTPVDPMAQITMFLTIFEKIDAIRGGGGESKPKDWRAMLAEGVVQKGPEMLRELRETFTVNKDAAEAKRAAAEAQERTATAIRSIPAANPAPAAPGGTVPTTTVMPSGPLRTVPIDRTNGAAPADAIPSNVAPVAAPGMSPVESDAVANFMQHRIVEMIADDRDAEDVVDFIEEVDPSMNDLLVQFSPEMVTTFLSSRPIISEATQFPNWNAFLTAAQSYIKEIREEDKAIAAAAGAVPS